MTDKKEPEQLDENSIILERRAKLKEIREKRVAFPNNFYPDSYSKDLHLSYDDDEKETLSDKNINVLVAGRMVLKRVMGKASFATIQDASGRIQLYVARDIINSDKEPELYADFKRWDLGDIIGVKGKLFKTKTNELTIEVSEIIMLTKSLRPLPEKFHGLADQETKYRKRYLDLICNDDTWKTFNDRFKIIKTIRRFFDDKNFIEVETPMMQKIPGGATARPFVTHHNTLDLDLFMRIAPELYLKRLIVGGFEKIYEINRNFRNEGVSSKHNPEFTMIEFYQTYADYKDMMDTTENLLKYVVNKIKGCDVVIYQDHEINFGKPFKRVTLKNSILEHSKNIDMSSLEDKDKAIEYCKTINLDVSNYSTLGEIQFAIFEKIVEPNLVDPTFITEYPIEVSPLARVNNDNPLIADRFEFFIMGKEIANGFSELNDPDDQRKRFEEQAKLKDGGDDEAMYFDEDYIEALEYGMPPTAGEGIGIDRLVMILTDSPSIRDVLLFPLMR